MTVDTILAEARKRMKTSLETLKKEMATVRTGRANAAILDSIHVDYYGTPTPLNQVANVTLLDARTISVQPWEKGMGAKIEKAIRDIAPVLQDAEPVLREIDDLAAKGIIARASS